MPQQKPLDPDQWLGEKRAQLDPDVWVAEQQAKQPPPPKPGWASRVLTGAGQEVKTQIEAIPPMVGTLGGITKSTHMGRPMEAGEQLAEVVLDPLLQQRAKAQEAFARGERVKGLGYTLASRLPLIGPQAAEYAEAITEDIPTGLGRTATGVLALFGLPRAIAGAGREVGRRGAPLPTRFPGIEAAKAETSQGMLAQTARTEAGAGGFPIAEQYVTRRDVPVREAAARLSEEIGARPTGAPAAQELQARARDLAKQAEEAQFRAEEARLAANLAERQQVRGRMQAERGALTEQQVAERAAYEEAQRLLMGQAAEQYAPGITPQTAGEVIAPAVRQRAFYREPARVEKPVAEVEAAAPPGTLAAPTPERPLEGLLAKPERLRGPQVPETAPQRLGRTPEMIENQVRESDAVAQAQVWLQNYETGIGELSGKAKVGPTPEGPLEVVGRFQRGGVSKVIPEIDEIVAGNEAKANAIREDADNPLYRAMIDRIKSSGPKYITEEELGRYVENESIIEQERFGMAQKEVPAGFDVFDEAKAALQGEPPPGSLPRGTEYSAATAEIVDSLTGRRIPWRAGADPRALVEESRRNFAAENAQAMREAQVPAVRPQAEVPVAGRPVELPALPMKAGKVHVGKVKNVRDVEAKVWNELDRAANERQVDVTLKRAREEAAQPSAVSREAWERLKTNLSRDSQQILSRLAPGSEYADLPGPMREAVLGADRPVSWDAARQGYSAISDDLRSAQTRARLGSADTKVLRTIRDALGEDIDRALQAHPDLREAQSIGRQLTTYKHKVFEQGPAAKLLRKPEEAGAIEPTRIGRVVPRMSEEKFRAVREAIGPQAEAQKALTASVVRDIYEQARTKGATEAGAVDYQKALKILENKKYRTMLGEKGYADLRAKIQADMARGQKIVTAQEAATKGLREAQAREIGEMRKRQVLGKPAAKVAKSFEAEMQEKFVRKVAAKEPETIIPDLLSLKKGQPQVTAAKRLRAMIGSDTGLLKRTQKALFDQSMEEAIAGKTAGRAGIVVGPKFGEAWANTRQVMEALGADSKWLADVDDFASELAKHALSEKVARGPSALGSQIQKGVLVTAGAAAVTGKLKTAFSLASYVVSPKLLLRVLLTPEGPGFLSRALKTPAWAPQAGEIVSEIQRIGAIAPKEKKELR